MSFFRYLRDNARFILLYFLLAAFVAAMAGLDAHSRMLPGNYGYMAAVSFTLFAACVAVDYAVRRKRAARLNELIASPDKTPVLPPPADYKDEQYAALISGLYAQYMESLGRLEEDYRENKEFMAAWAHEVKTPITAMRLLLDAEADGESKAALEEELGRIHSAVERVLFHARSDSFSKDFVISEEPLAALVRESVKKHSALFIRRRIRLSIGIPEALSVQTDRKWLVFILDQLVSNALKYTPENGEIALSAADEGGATAFRCADNGRGISAADIERVFAKSFTGRAGREPGSSATGLGLYLARKLSGKLGHEISIESEYQKGTIVTLRFAAPDDLVRLTKT
jgi:signal transduction histidine kinase